MKRILKDQERHICSIVFKEWVHWLIVLSSLYLRGRFVMLISAWFQNLVCAYVTRMTILMSRISNRLKLRKSGRFKECYRGSGPFLTCQVLFVGALAKESMTWRLGNTRKQNPLPCHLMYATICNFSFFLHQRAIQFLFLSVQNSSNIY